MKNKFTSFVFCLLMLSFISCNEKPAEQEQINTGAFAVSKRTADISAEDRDSILRSLDELADLERAGSWFTGIALTESGLREKIGNYAGAVAAVYKELAYAYGIGAIEKEYIEECLFNILEARNEEEITSAINGILAFMRGQWGEALNILVELFDQADEPDGFGRWLILACNFENILASRNTGENNGENRRTEAEYKSIRARYVHFPEYWYRGARFFSGSASAEYAENCINISPEGPFAGECRAILAVYSGLKPEDGSSIKTMMEIETIISQSVNSGSPEILEPLMPLIGLPDNPYTVYAISALRSLTTVPGFRDYFNGKASGSGGRLAERLLYISRG